MKQIVLSVMLMCLLSLSAFGQSKVKVRTYSDKQEIEKVFAEYLKVMQMADIKERDKIRERLLTEDYCYMGTDGIAVTKKQVMARQARNQLRLDSIKTTDLTVRVYDNTAILTMRFTNSGTDKGQPFSGGTNGFTTVMVKQKGVWLIAADIIGREIEN